MASDPYFLHDFCIILNCHLDPTMQLFKNMFFLESIFFKELYLAEREAKNLFKLPLEYNDKYNFEFLDCPLLEKTKLDNTQLGDSYSVCYKSTSEGNKGAELMTKTYKVTKFLATDKDMHISYFVKEKLNPKEIVGFKNDELINQYELFIAIKSIDTKIMLYIRLELHPTHQIACPFTKEFRSRLEETVIVRSKDPIFRKNYENLESVVINAPRKQVFQIINSLRVFKGCEVYYSTEIENPKIWVGRRFKVILHQLSSNLEFEIVDHYYSDDNNEDSRITGRLIKSEPEHVLFDYSYILKTISDNQQLILFKHVFEEAITPDLMKHHSEITRTVLLSLKELAESEHIK